MDPVKTQYATQQTLAVIDMWLRAQGCDIRDYVLYINGYPLADLRSLVANLAIEKCLAVVN